MEEKHRLIVRSKRLVTAKRFAGMCRDEAHAGVTTPQPHAPSSSASHVVPSFPEVVVMSIAQPDVEVAWGLLKSQDPTTLVAGIRLGEGFSEVLLKVPVVIDESLIRPYG
ncbi:uncharacterized protein LOC143882269 [Tasmannia lanceolata]|uniref:uncharacterized protein LOC143882269 n=1 Tax=Tasmannia lanceolata TaxID=3420 RepID=UPI004064A5E6